MLVESECAKHRGVTIVDKLEGTLSESNWSTETQPRASGKGYMLKHKWTEPARAPSSSRMLLALLCCSVVVRAAHCSAR